MVGMCGIICVSNMYCMGKQCVISIYTHILYVSPSDVLLTIYVCLSTLYILYRYNKLPSLFLAFDLYNTHTKQFYARSVIESKLVGTTLTMVPLLFKGVLTHGKSQILAMLQTKSHYSDENRLEGVYIKQNGKIPANRHNNDNSDNNDNSIHTDDGNMVEVVTHRSKVVRSDFICGNSHWNKYNVEANCVVNDQW